MTFSVSWRPFGLRVTGSPEHVELRLNGFTIGLGTVEAARRVHGIEAAQGSPAMVLIVWTDDVDDTYRQLVAAGVPAVQSPHDTGNCNRNALLRDPDGEPRGDRRRASVRRGTGSGHARRRACRHRRQSGPVARGASEVTADAPGLSFYRDVLGVAETFRTPSAPGLGMLVVLPLRSPARWSRRATGARPRWLP